MFVELFFCFGMKLLFWFLLISLYKFLVVLMLEIEVWIWILFIYVLLYDKLNEIFVLVGNVIWNLMIFIFFYFLSFLKSWDNFWVKILLF